MQPAPDFRLLGLICEGGMKALRAAEALSLSHLQELHAFGAALPAAARGRSAGRVCVGRPGLSLYAAQSRSARQR